MLKKVLISLIIFVAFPIQSAQLSTLDYLLAMMDSHQHRNYEILYTLRYGDKIADSYRYRHAHFNNQEFAQQINLDNAREEIVLNHNTVSYSGNGVPPFSLNATAILDNLPAIFHADFILLNKYYDFVEFGRERIADRIARGIRIVPKDNDHYRYTLWIDENSGLLLKSELTDQNGSMLEQFKVIQALESEQVLSIVSPIQQLIQPAKIHIEPTENKAFNWQVKWLPNGFKLQPNHRIHSFDFGTQKTEIQSRHYTDGLFSFTIYVSDDDDKNQSEHFWQENATTIYMRTYQGKNMVLIGTLPISTAQHILQHITFDEVAQ